MEKKVAPLRNMILIPTDDANSFTLFDSGETGLPLPPHPGAFGVERRHHVHEGIDLYAPEGTEVVAMESGLVVAVISFTGEQAGFPWWENTDAVLVESSVGVICYGEVEACVKIGEEVAAGTVLGRVKRVLRKNKGRPMSMLHLELHSHGTRVCPEWTKEKGRPATLLNPTELLMSVARF